MPYYYREKRILITLQVVYPHTLLFALATNKKVFIKMFLLINTKVAKLKYTKNKHTIQKILVSCLFLLNAIDIGPMHVIYQGCKVLIYHKQTYNSKNK